MQKNTVAFSKESSNLFFHILTKCNLRCSHCYINREQHGDLTLSLSTIRSWFEIFAPKAQQTNLVLLGGEPTLHPDLAQIIKLAGQMAFKSITIDTNGFLFHDILNKITPQDLDFISFSLDGATSATNDAIRGQGCWDAVMAGIKRATDLGFACSMIYTVSEKNIHELNLMPDLVKDMGISRFFIQVIGLRGESTGPNTRDQVSKETWQTTIPKVAKQIAAHKIIVTYPKVFLDLDQPFECAGNVADNYFVFPNGRVYQCPICEDFPLHSHSIENNQLVPRPKINETDLFALDIPEGCVMNKMIQPGNLAYDPKGNPCHKIECCMLKEEIVPWPHKIMP
ncbi:MAG: radical SAM protein [Desulfobacter sp.]|nr:MAG: radical SAM protein [Desulfobacter sp.]